MNHLRFRAAAEIAADTEALQRRLQQLLSTPQPDAQAIHRIRVTCKRLRSLVRLRLHHRSKSGCKPYDHALRAVAAAFGAARDDTVLHDTLALLQARTRSKPTQAALRRALAQLPPQHAACQRDATAEKLALAPLPALRRTQHRLEHGLHRTQKRCNKLAQYAIAGGTDAAPLHGLRKWVKYLGYQLELVVAADAAMTRRHKQLAALGSLLGVIHDLDVLQQRLQQGLCSDDDAALIATLAERLRLQAIRRAARMAAKLFSSAQ